MRTHLSLYMLLLGLVAFLALGCGSDDDNGNPSGPGGGGGGTDAIDLSSAQVEIPAAMSNAASGNAGAAQATALITLANSFMTYSSWWTPPALKFHVPTNALGADTTISWSQGDMSIILELNTAGSATTWMVTLNGSDGEQNYENFIYMEGYQMLDGSGGNMSIKDPSDPGSDLLYWEWLVDPDDVFILNLYSSDDDGTLTVGENPNGSGSVSQTLGTVLSFEANWNSDGSGSYTFYDGQGDPQDTGTWPAL